MIKNNFLFTLKSVNEKFYLVIGSFIFAVIVQYFNLASLKVAFFLFLSYTSLILMILAKGSQSMNLQKLVNILFLNLLTYTVVYLFYVYILAGRVERFHVIPESWPRSVSYKEIFFLFQTEMIFIVETMIFCVVFAVFLWCASIHFISRLDYNFPKALRMSILLVGKFPSVAFKASLFVIFLGVCVLLFLSILSDGMDNVGINSSFFKSVALFIESYTVFFILTFHITSVAFLTSKEEFQEKMHLSDAFRVIFWAMVLFVIISCSSIVQAFFRLPAKSAIKSNSVDNFMRKCNGYLFDKDYNLASECYHRVLDMVKGDVHKTTEVFILLGNANNKMGKYSEAKKFLEDALSFKPSSPYAWYHFGVSSYFLQDKKNAVKAWMKCTDLGDIPYSHACRKTLKRKLGIDYGENDSKKRN